MASALLSLTTSISEAEATKKSDNQEGILAEQKQYEYHGSAHKIDPSASAIESSLFLQPVDRDYLCVLCKGAPIHPVSLTHSCASTCCKECLETHVATHKKCPSCQEAMETADAVPAAHIAAKLAALVIRCPYCDALDPTSSNKCLWTSSLGKEAIRLKEHLRQCPFTVVSCSCGIKLQRKDLVAHQGSDPEGCQWEQKLCVTCNQSLLRRQFSTHELSQPHLLRSLAKMSSVVADVAQVKADNLILKTEVDTLRKNAQLLRAEMETQIVNAETRSEQR